MITVIVKRVNSCIASIDIQGHALFAPKGKDLVCAGVSSIAVGGMNALEELAHGVCRLQMEEGKIMIQVQDFQSEKAQFILETILIQLLTMEESYGNYIQIKQ